MIKNNLNIFIFVLIGILSGLLSYFSNFSSINLVLITSVLLPLICFFSLIKSGVLKKISLQRFLLLGLVLFSLEIIGAKTGVIYGDFKYNVLFQPQLFETPLVMFFVWGTLVVEAYSLSTIFNKKAVKALLVGILLVITDLVIDPGAIKLGLWSWANSGPWYGVPWSNYIGWLILGTLGAAILIYKENKNNLLVTPLFTIYIASFWSIYNLMNGMILSSLIGLVLVLVILLIKTNLDKVNNSI